MSLFLLIFKSAFRNRLRTLLTSVGVAIAIVAFLFLRTFISAWFAGVEGSSSDRLVVRNKTSIIFSLPLAYVEKVKSIVGDRGMVSYENWFGGVYPKDEKAFFGNLAADPQMFEIYPEIVLPPDQRQAYLEDRKGAIVGVRIAEKYGWKVGDRVVLRGTIYPGDWEFNIRGIYRSTTTSVDEATLFFHWKYLNDGQPEVLKDKIGFLFIKVTDPSQSNAIAAAIDREFASSQAETRTESEKSFQLEFVAMSSAVIGAIQVVSGVVLVILMLILANTLAMATRERTSEYAVMRAMGFHPRHIVAMVLGEGFVVALVGSALGVALSAPIVRFFGKTFEKNIGAFITGFDLKPGAVVLAVLVALGLGMLAAALPAYRAGRLKIVDALRRVE